jgi:hypothetical protein
MKWEGRRDVLENQLTPQFVQRSQTRKRLNAPRSRGSVDDLRNQLTTHSLTTMWRMLQLRRSVRLHLHLRWQWRQYVVKSGGQRGWKHEGRRWNVILYKQSLMILRLMMTIIMIGMMNVSCKKCTLLCTHTPKKLDFYWFCLSDPPKGFWLSEPKQGQLIGKN